MSCGISLARPIDWLLPRCPHCLAVRTLIAAMLFLFLGGAAAMLMRWQLAYPSDPSRPVPLLGAIANWPDGTLPVETYNAAFTLHGTVMIFLAIIPALVGGFSTLLLPRWLGTPAKTLPLPTLYLAAFFLYVVAGLILLIGTLAGSPAAAGWTSYPPLSSIPSQLLSGPLFSGQAAWFACLALIANSGVLLAIAHLTAITSALSNHLRWSTLSIPAYSVLATAILLLLSGPVLVAAMAMNLTDLAGLTTFFRPASWLISGQYLPSPSSGTPLLHQHLFWFYAHPAVYIMILPVFGIITDLLERNTHQPVVARTGMILALLAIALLGFLVWAHHMFQTGLNPAAGTVFAIATVLIAIPSITKVFGWLATLTLRPWQWSPAIAAVLMFLSLFIVGGLSGVMLALPAINMHLHDSYFIVAHLHYVLFGGSLFGIFAAAYGYLPHIAQSKPLRRLAYTHLILSFITFNAAFGPMHVLGAMGMPRRVAEYSQYTTLPPAVSPMNKTISHAAFALGATQLLFLALAATALRFPPPGSRTEIPQKVPDQV
jgi:cytochrome c oxidase subunit 1